MPFRFYDHFTIDSIMFYISIYLYIRKSEPVNLSIKFTTGSISSRVIGLANIIL